MAWKIVLSAAQLCQLGMQLPRRRAKASAALVAHGTLTRRKVCIPYAVAGRSNVHILGAAREFAGRHKEMNFVGAPLTVGELGPGNCIRGFNV